MWGHFKDRVLKVCDEVCGKKSWRGNKGYPWWWKEEVMEAVSRKKEVCKAVCQNGTEESKRRYKSLKYEAMKAVSKTMKAVS